MAYTPILAKHLVLKYGTDIIALTTDFELTIDKEAVDITSFSSNGWKEKLVDLKEWSINFSGLVNKSTDTPDSGETDFHELLSDLKGSDDAVTVIIGSDTTTEDYETGLAFLTSLKMSGSVGDKVSYSGTLEGTAGLTTTVKS